MAAVVVLLTGFLAAAGLLQLRSAGADARRGVDRLEAARSDVDDLVALIGSEDSTDDDAAALLRAELVGAAGDFRSARSTLDSPVLVPVRFAPVLGRQLRAADALLVAGAEVTESLSGAVAELEQIADRPTEGAASRLEAVDDTEAVLAGLLPELDEPDLGPREGLLPQVADARNRFSDALAQTREAVRSSLVSLGGVASFLRGPNTYLVFAANNAEMRAGSGMFLQAGTMSISDGRIELSAFEPTSEMRLETSGTTLDPDVAARWGALAPDREWRNLNLTPRFDQTGRMAADMWQASGRGPVDGVLAMDVVAVVQLLELTGPVRIDGVEVDAAGLGALLLTEQYRAFDDTDQRRELLGRVLAATFEAFDERPVPVSALVRLFDRAGSERHLLMWSSDPTQQAAWSELGVSGELSADAMMLSLINRGANKLDPYVSMHAELSVAPGDGVRRVTVDVTLENSAPDGLPQYVAGPQPVSGARIPGDYVGIVALTVPGSATNPSVSTDGFAVLGDDGPVRVVGANVLVGPGEQRVVSIEFDLPAAVDVLRVLPSARLPPTTWTAGSESWTEQGPYLLSIAELD